MHYKLNETVHRLPEGICLKELTKPSKCLVELWTRKREGIYLDRVTKLAE